MAVTLKKSCDEPQFSNDFRVAVAVGKRDRKAHGRVINQRIVTCRLTTRGKDVKETAGGGFG